MKQSSINTKQICFSKSPHLWGRGGQDWVAAVAFSHPHLFLGRG